MAFFVKPDVSSSVEQQLAMSDRNDTDRNDSDRNDNDRNDNDWYDTDPSEAERRPTDRYGFDQYDEMGDDFERRLRMKRRDAHRKSRMSPDQGPRMSRAELVRTVTDVDESLETGFETTYKPSKHERGWIFEALSGFYFQGDITDVLRMVKGGKEAAVYQCVAGPSIPQQFVAAKIYRPRRFRNLRNDALYRQGRDHLDADGKHLKDDRAARAIQAGTARGKMLAHTSWLAHELTALQTLHDAGADVPRPLASGPNVILMDYLGDESRPARALNEVSLDPAEAWVLFERVLANVELMLEQDIVHGDLSAYNILYQDGRVTLIDFPQVIDPHRNPAARAIFDRDLERVCGYFRAQGVDCDAPSLAEEIWGRALDVDPWHDPEGLPSMLSLMEQRRAERDLEAEMRREDG